MKTLILICLMSISQLTPAQTPPTKLWTEQDRKYLLENLIRSRDELVKETDGLTEQQWRFKESPDRWSINEVVEHITIYELLFDRQITQTLAAKAQPELNASAKADSTYFNFVMEPKPHNTLDYSKPFSYTVPRGLSDGKFNMTWFLKMRNESIDYLQSTKDDLRAHYIAADRPNVHQVYIYVFGHVDRALRQIRRVKQDGKYPGK